MNDEIKKLKNILNEVIIRIEENSRDIEKNTRLLEKTTKKIESLKNGELKQLLSDLKMKLIHLQSYEKSFELERQSLEKLFSISSEKLLYCSKIVNQLSANTELFFATFGTRIDAAFRNTIMDLLHEYKIIFEPRKIKGDSND